MFQSKQIYDNIMYHGSEHPVVVWLIKDLVSAISHMSWLACTSLHWLPGCCFLLYCYSTVFRVLFTEILPRYTPEKKLAISCSSAVSDIC